MDVIKKAIVDWLREILIGGIISNLSGMFDSVNEKVGEAIVEVGKSPSAWNSSIFSMVQNLSETVMIPIAGVILAFVMTLELIQLVTDRNNLHDIDTWMFFKWSFKTAAAVLIVTNTWNIVMGIFDAAQSVVNSAGGVIVSDASIDISSVVADLETRLAEMELGPLFGLWFQSLFVGITMWALTICIFIIVYGRMIEIYLVTSIAPIPMATMMNREWGQTGQNYLRGLLALGFQAQYVATALEIYVTGSLNVFNHRTNVDIQNRIVAFDIKELGKQLKKIGMLVVQDQVWNRVTVNREAHKATRYYIDEFHLLLKEEQTAAYSVEIWKRFRKWGGVPTGITQNVKDLLASREVENIFENSDYIYMLNQASGDRQILAKQLNISPHQLSYVTHSGEGEGLLFYGNIILPFVDRFPKDTELYRVMTTKPNEVSGA